VDWPGVSPSSSAGKGAGIRLGRVVMGIALGVLGLVTGGAGQAGGMENDLAAEPALLDREAGRRG
jgi:hypothetical protein